MHKKNIIIGAGGFLGSSVINGLVREDTQLVTIGRNNIDLLQSSGINLLHELVNDGDSVFLFSAIAPCKTPQQFAANSTMAEILCEGLSKINLDSFTYVSSDAVYADSSKPINENSLVAPQSLHGIMHRSREFIFDTQINSDRKLFLRPTSVYGYTDPHNGYGPNQFARQSNNNNLINVVGMGEELRDHISILDFSNIFNLLVRSEYSGYVNICSGTAITFLEIAKIISHFNKTTTINFIDRTSPMPHNGYRTFDISLLKSLTGEYIFESLETYLKNNYAKYG